MEKFTKKLRILYPDLATVSDQQLLEVYHKDTGEYVNKAKEYKRAQRTKHAWRKNRGKFMRAIKSYNRLPKLSTAKDDATSKIAKAKKRKVNDESLTELDCYTINAELLNVKTILMEEATEYRLEESFIEITDVIDSLLEGLTEVELLLHERNPGFEDLFLEILDLIETESTDESGEEEQSDDEDLP